MNPTIKELIDKILPIIIPLIIMKGDSNSIYAPIILALAVPIITNIMDWYNTKFKKVYSYTIYEHDVASGAFSSSIANNQFKYFSYLLEKKAVLSDHIMCYSSTITKKEIRDGWYHCDPLNIGKNISEIAIGDHKYNIVHNIDLEKKNSSYYITGNSKESIQALIQCISNIENEYVTDKCIDKRIMCYKYDTSASRYIANNINIDKNFDNIFLENQVKKTIMENIDNFINNPQTYKKFGIQRKIGFLFYGPPGNGKTSIALAISSFYNKNIYKLDLSMDKVKFYDQVRNIRPGSVVLMDDVDTFGVTNDRADKDKVETKTLVDKLLLSDVLEVLDGYYYLNECIVIATTNCFDKLDPAFFRPGRFDHRIEFKNATRPTVIEMMTYYFGNGDYELLVSKFTDSTSVSVSEIINTIIIPNIRDVKRAIKCLNRAIDRATG